MKFSALILPAVLVLLFAHCASTPTEVDIGTIQAATFSPPGSDLALQH